MHISQFLYHSFAPSLFQKGGIAYDLGANHGQFAAYLSQNFDNVVAVEPNPNIDLADLASNVTVMRCAVGFPTSSGTFRLAGVDDASKLVQSSNSSPCNEGEDILVKIMSLKDLFNLHPNSLVSLVKMDIEGAELDILLGEDPDVLTMIYQLTVEFHDFNDPASLPTVLKAIKRMEDLGFVTLQFSITTYGDVLFLNSRHIQGFSRIWVLLRYRWLRGMMRRVRRRLSPGACVPGGYTFLK